MIVMALWMRDSRASSASLRTKTLTFNVKAIWLAPTAWDNAVSHVLKERTMGVVQISCAAPAVQTALNVSMQRPTSASPAKVGAAARTLICAKTGNAYAMTFWAGPAVKGWCA